MKTMRGQKGQVFIMVLAVLAIGSLFLIPALFFMSTSSLASQNAVAQARGNYSADGGVEHALWRLRYEPGFAASLTGDPPTAHYSIDLNGTPTGVTVTSVFTETPPVPPGGDESQSGRITVNKTADPSTIPPLQTTVVTYTLLVENVGTSRVHLEKIGDNLPQSFHYLDGTSSGFTTVNPTITIVDDKEVLEWAFTTPLPYVDAGQTGTQSFQAEATPPGGGLYYNEGWVVADPDSIDYVSSGTTAPVEVEGGLAYNIVSTANGLTVQARVAVSADGIYITSWQVVK